MFSEYVWREDRMLVKFMRMAGSSWRSMFLQVSVCVDEPFKS
jgi:hypothetical protein